MKFRAIYQRTSNNAQSPVRVVEQSTGGEIGWINRYLDREYVRRLADTTLRIYAHNLLHFVRWWESVHHTGDVVEGDLTGRAAPGRGSGICLPRVECCRNTTRLKTNLAELLRRVSRRPRALVRGSSYRIYAVVLRGRIPS
jgi:hypothetical protein